MCQIFWSEGPFSGLLCAVPSTCVLLRQTVSLFKPSVSVCRVVCHLSSRTQKMLKEITNPRPLMAQIRIPRLQDSPSLRQFVEEINLRWTQAMCQSRGMAWRNMSLWSVYAQHTVHAGIWLAASACVSLHQVSGGEQFCRSWLCRSSAGVEEATGCSLNRS